VRDYVQVHRGCDEEVGGAGGRPRRVGVACRFVCDNAEDSHAQANARICAAVIESGSPREGGKQEVMKAHIARSAKGGAGALSI